ncbi:hypothetical protein SAMN04487948_11626 [Halogranum amylolyticum]|uniref:Regulatory protein, FmdB family n=1 Tax=Halogranum amylolyticum TaxID=660520 RepID=A0A1H8VEU9_9EURY|nr:hypothetical protein SAMN04487948_11626 [Halogranum amylolyticum]
MPYFECTECGQLATIGSFERSELRQHCPVCETQTVWEVAFESDSGVSF